MGSGSWSAVSYNAAAAFKATRGIDDFQYSTTMKSSAPISDWKVHPDLDPKRVAGDGSPLAGQRVRESRDSDEHPNSVPIAVIFDETGSMGGIPKVLQKKLNELFGMLLRKGYVEHPQVLYGAVGDAYSDRVPLQIGQFESDNRSDEDLEKIFLEGNGGGQRTESYDLAMYYMARHTVTDAWEKRGKRGYLFLIGDESYYPNVNARQVREIIGDDLAEPLSTEALMRELQEKWDVYFIIPQHGSYFRHDDITESWRKLLEQNVILLDDETAVCETIALAVGLAEGTVDLDGGLDDLADVGADARAIKAAGKALAKVGGGSGTLATTDLPTADDDTGIDRL
jgi:hypothetical protein